MIIICKVDTKTISFSIEMKNLDTVNFGYEVIYNNLIYKGVLLKKIFLEIDSEEAMDLRECFKEVEICWHRKTLSNPMPYLARYITEIKLK